MCLYELHLRHTLTSSIQTRTLCVRDNDASDEDKKKQYEEKLKEKIKEKFEKFKEKVQERLDKKKDSKNKEWEEKDKQRQDKRNQRKFRRMAVCTPAVAAAIGTTAMLEMADGGFSEDLFDNIEGDMLELWPGADIDDDWLENALPDDESDITKEDYVAVFLEVGDANAENAKRSISIKERDIEPHDTINPTVEDARPIIREKRNIFTAIANAFRSFVRGMITVATKSANKAKQATKYFSEGKQPNLKKPGEAKLSRADQKGKAKEISQNKNWTKCLRGEKPEK
jgi:hypothetical protein